MIKIIIIITIATFGFLALAGIGAILYSFFLLWKASDMMMFDYERQWEEENFKEQKKYNKFLSDKLNEYRK